MTDYELVDPPSSERAHELWLQHAVGFILFENVRRYAMEKIDPSISADARRAVEQGIDDAVYGLMILIDGVSGGLSNAKHQVQLNFIARHVKLGEAGPIIAKELDLFNGDGMCMGYHGWLEGDFGSDPVARPIGE